MIFRSCCACLLLFVLSGCASNHVARAKAGTQQTHIKFTCRVYVDANGIAKTAEIIKIEPAIEISDKAKQDLLSVSVLNKTFTPNQENGKPVAGYLTVPIDLDFDDPVPLDGT